MQQQQQQYGIAQNVRKLRQLYVLGLLISGYAAYVELRSESNANYHALCDISPKISCTAVFNTPYGKGFGLLRHFIGTNSMWNLPNGIWGMTYYVLQLCCSVFHRQRGAMLFSLICCIASNLMSIYLAYLLYFVLVDLCLVCVAIYVVNFIALLRIIAIHKRLLMLQNENNNNNNNIDGDDDDENNKSNEITVKKST